MEAIKKLTREALESEINSMNRAIDDIGCFGSKDVLYREMLYREAEKRGYEILEYHTVKLRKFDE